MGAQERLDKLLDEGTMPSGQWKQQFFAGYENVVVAPGEADVWIGEQVASDQDCYVISTDSDLLLAYKTRNFIKVAKKGNFLFYNVDELRRNIGVDLQLLAIVCGTDYNSNIPTYGPVKNVKVLKKLKIAHGDGWDTLNHRGQLEAFVNHVMEDDTDEEKNLKLEQFMLVSTFFNFRLLKFLSISTKVLS